MAEKRFYWLRLKRDFFKRHDIRIIESLPNGKDYCLFYLKLLCESVDHEGNLRFSDQIPYSEDMLATITNTNLNSLRDWGYAKDYIECMWLILQQPEPDDFVIATGEYHTVREFATLAFKEVGIELEWRGDGVDEKGYDKATGKPLVEVDPKYFRPAEVDQLLGNPAKAKAKLGWNPQKTSFPELVKIMVQHDMKFVKKLFIKAQMEE